MDSRSNQTPELLYVDLPTETLGKGLPALAVKSGIDRLLEHDIEPERNLGR